MFIYPDINPVAFSVGFFKVHWYGLMYLLGFAGAWLLGVMRARQPDSGWTTEQVGDLIFYGALGVILGGRLGYMLFYDMQRLWTDPVLIFKVWQGGMSFHGGMLGVLVALALYSRKIQKSFFSVTDFVAPLVPLGLAAGRLGNFINGELWGRETSMPWGVVYPHVDSLPRHPSVVYEFLLEGILLFIILWFFSRKPRPRMAVSGLFLLCYGSFRFFVEFFRQPDLSMGFVAWGWLTMGQLLSLPMVIFGILMLFIAYKKSRKNKCNNI